MPSFRGSVSIDENPIYYLEDGETVEVILEMTQNGEQSEIYQGPMSSSEFPFVFNDFYSSSSDPATVVMYIDDRIYIRSGETEPAIWAAEFTAED